MFSYLFSWYEYFFPKENTDDEDNDKALFLAEQLLDLELSNQNNDFEKKDEPEQIPEAACFQRTGTITFATDAYILIDGQFYFELNSCSLNVNQDDRVLYLGYKPDEETLKIVRLLENLGPAWGESIENEEDTFSIMEHIVIGEVDHREDRTVYLKDRDLNFNLDTVEATFVPMTGDWLQMKCTVQFDDSKPADVSSKQVLTVLSVKALRFKAVSSKVTNWNGDWGICNQEIWFNKHALHNGLSPQVGSHVMVQAIESNQGLCGWRALSVITDDDHRSVCENKVTTEETIEELSLKIEKEKNIEMMSDIKFEKVVLRESDSKKLTIINNSDQVYTLQKWVVLNKMKDSQIVIKPFLHNSIMLHPKQNFSFNLICQPKFLGNSKEVIVFKFKGFQMKRIIEINVEDGFSNRYSNGNHDRKSEADLVKSMTNIRRHGTNSYIPGVRPVKPPAFISVRLENFPIPDDVWSAVLGDSDQTIYSRDYNKIINRIEEHFPFLCSGLTVYNYKKKWHTLLYMEEVQLNIQMRAYDQPKTFLNRHQEYLGIEIKGLSEKRPSIIAGDSVIITENWDTKNEYQGFVHMVRGDLLLLKFNPLFHESYSGCDVSIKFNFSRSVFRKCHQAINLAMCNLGPDLLFPCRLIHKTLQVPLEKTHNISWFNKNLNMGQKTAVTNILLGECRPMPYCIFGPPGTGKTVTVVETVLQILKLLPESRILLATPSNSAANLVTERLTQYKGEFSDSVVRLIANHLLESDNLPDSIKPFCATLDIAKENTSKSNYRVNKNGINENCQSSFIGRHRVTIGTCGCLGSLAQIGLPRGHFTHVIVDEAGQATEPEIMIPMTFTDKENGQIILAGDPMQLGPVVMSKYCQEFGLSESYLSRLLERFPYQKDYVAFSEGYDSRLVTKLNDNYRSLEEVLRLPNDMFYDGTLVPKINRNQPWISKLLKISSDIFSVDKQEGGVFVYGIRGVNARAEDSPSWFNPQEASMVALTTCKLYKNEVSPDDIGIISPYIAQIKHIRLVFSAMGLEQPKIGTVEEFQGQERPIILISTVRSTESLLEDDLKHTLGFVKHPKRLNVALTRAQVAVILFCNPHLLCHDPLWERVISQSVRDDKYIGCDLPMELQTEKQNK